MLYIENSEADIIYTNFWDTDFSKKGKLFLSFNAGAFRLLVPESREAEIEEMKTGELVIVSQGFWNEVCSYAFEILFEDYTDTPYVIHLTTASADMLLQEKQRTDLIFSVWTKGCKKVLELPCYFRRVQNIPYLREWGM